MWILLGDKMEHYLKNKWKNRSYQTKKKKLITSKL